MVNEYGEYEGLTDYVLPGGRVVRVDDSAAKGAPLIGFTLENGLQVSAIRRELMPPYEVRRQLRDATLKVGR